MNKFTKALLSVMATFCFSCFSAYAVQITPSDTKITLGKNDKEITFDIYLETDAAFAGAEFGIKPSQSDVKLSSVTFAEEWKNESKVQTVKDGCLYFGFFSNTNQYRAGKQKIATLQYSYSGSGERSISLTESKIVTLNENNKTSGDTSAEPFTVTITRSGSSSGGGSGGGSSGGGSGGSSGGGSGGSSGGGSSSGGDSSSDGNASSGGSSSEEAPDGDIKKPDITLPDTSKPYAEKTFTDIGGHWAENDIKSCVKNGLFTGISDTLFDPSGTVTRAMAITVLGRFSQDAVESTETAFADVPADAYYAKYVSWGAENGIVKGMSETAFAPENPITREQISAMIVRYLQDKGMALPVSSANIQSHSDYEQISDYAKETMAICYEMGLIKGFDSGLLEPKGNLTRAQFASVMARLSAYMETIK